MFKKFLSLLIALLIFAFPCLAEVIVDGDLAMDGDVIVEYGYDYLKHEEVGLYLHAFCELPPNYITKAEARDMGWDSSKGNLWEATGGLSIGGDKFGNREGLLPEAKGRQYYECDVNVTSSKRGAERIVFSDDGLIYFTEDHYESFDLLYDGWYEWETIIEDEINPSDAFMLDGPGYDSYDYNGIIDYDTGKDYATEDMFSDLLGDLIGGLLG